MPSDNSLHLTDFLRKSNVICNLPPVGRDGTIRQLAELLFKNDGGFDLEHAIAALLERESVEPTVLAEGLALPHARLDDLQRPLVAVATSRHGIDFKARESGKVSVVVLVLAPKSDPGVYLRVVAAVSKNLGIPLMIKRLGLCTSAEEIHQLLAEGSPALSPHVTAKDVMDPRPITLKESDTLGTAIQTFCSRRIHDIPIIDETGDIRGIVYLEDILTLSLPEHLLWLEDLSPIVDLQPFAELLSKDRDTKVADFMHDEFVSVGPDAPAIQLAKMFLTHEIRQIQVLDGRKLRGTVDFVDFVTQMFWT